MVIISDNNIMFINLLEVSCFWLFVKLLVYYIKVEGFAIQDHRGTQCPLTPLQGNTVH